MPSKKHPAGWRRPLEAFLSRRRDHRKVDRSVKLERLLALETRQLLSTYMVTNTNDTGVGSLRQAIQSSNSSGSNNQIQFSIAGGGVQVITPLSPLPSITATVTISGKTQPTYSGSPLIEIAGGSAGSSAIGLEIAAPSTSVTGLSIVGFGGAGIQLDDYYYDSITSNDIGITPSGSAVGNGIGVNIQLASQSTIGGTTAGMGNVVSGNSTGIAMASAGSGTSNNLVVGNFIGTNIAGTAAVPNGVGIDDQGTGDTIGGVAGTSGNVISGNTSYGVYLHSPNPTYDVVEGNYLGLNATGTGAVPNLGDAVYLGSNGNTIGGSTATGAGNVISGNGNASNLYVYGVVVAGTSNNLIAGNIFGLDALGTTEIQNIRTDIFLNNSPNNTIGGTAAGLGNVISGSNESGIYAEYEGASGNLIVGNDIGTDESGLNAPGGNPYSGITLDGAPNNTIGGATAGARNLISGNAGGGDPDRLPVSFRQLGERQSRPG